MKYPDGTVFLKLRVPNEVIRRGPYSEIVLRDRRGDIVATAQVDNEEVEDILKVRWHVANTTTKTEAKNSGRSAYFEIHGHIITSGGQQKCICLHKLLCPTPPGYVVDHRDRNVFNVMKANLRPATIKENASNKLGAGFYRESRKEGEVKYRGQIRINGRKICLGRFNTEQEAREAYHVAKIKHCGEFAPTLD